MIRYSTAPAYGPKTGTYRGKGGGSAGKKIPRDPAETSPITSQRPRGAKSVS